MTWSTPPALDFGDVVADLCLMLRGNPLLGGAAVVTDLTGYQAPQRVVYLERAGGTRSRFFDDAYIVCEARGVNYDDAYELAQAARSLLWTSPKTVTNVKNVTEVVGLMRLADPVTEDQFWRWTVTVRRQGTSY